MSLEINDERKAEISINKFKLDEEFIKQPDLVLHFSDIFTLLKKKVSDQEIVVDSKKDLLKTIKAIIELKIRTGEIKTDLKLTESTVEALTLSNEDVLKAQLDVIESKEKLNELIFQCDSISSIIDSLKHKKSSLENLTTLYVAGYYSLPNKNISEKIKQNLNNRSV